MNFQPVSERVDIAQMEDYYKSCLSSGNSKMKALEKTCEVFQVGKTTVNKYCVPKREKKIIAVSPEELKQRIWGKHVLGGCENKITEFTVGTLPSNFINAPQFSQARTFIITGWEIRCQTNYKFIDCLKQIAKTYNGRLQLAPCFTDDLKFLTPEVRAAFDDVLTADYHYNENLFFKFVQTHALANSPLQGWRGAFDKTAIIPGLIKEMFSEPSQKACKWIVSTGSLGHLDPELTGYLGYRDSQDEGFRKSFEQRLNRCRSQKKTTAIAQEFVKPSALVVHVLDEKLFLIRPVTMEQDGVVYDLDKKYTAGKRSPEASRPAFLSVGDTHEWVADEVALQATYDQIFALKPREVFLHDFVDGMSANHHEKDRALVFHEAPSIDEEIRSAIKRLEYIKSLCDTAGSSLGYIKSNHCDFFEKYIDAGERYWKLNRNYNTCVRLQHLRHETGKHPIELLIPFEELGIKYITDKQPYRTVGIDVHHGHAPINGKRAIPKALIQHYNYTSFMHFHSPGWWRNGMWGGLTGDPKQMKYLAGINGMMNSNVIGHPDGSQQLLTTINGAWKI